MKLIGIDIGGTKCAVIEGNEHGEILRKIRFDTTTCEDTLKNIFSAVEEFVTPEVKAIGISCGSPLDSKKGMIQSPPNLPGWDNVPIVPMLEERFHIPAFLKNDADACAIAEWKWGAGRGYDNIVFLTFGTGMGAGLILNGKPYSGAADFAGEVGHIRIREDGHIGYGKAGSFEGYCSGGGIAQYGKGSVKELAAKAYAGDSEALDIFSKVGDDLGRGVSVLIDILNPELIIIGSVYPRCKDLLDRTFYARLQKECLSFSLDSCRIVGAGLGESIGDMAALSIAYDNVK